MPRTSETFRIVNSACREHGWKWRHQAKPFDHVDWFERDAESIRVVCGLWLGAPSNFYFIDRRQHGKRSIWVVQIGMKAAPALGGVLTKPHIVLKARAGKPRHTFAAWFKNTFLTGSLDPERERIISERMFGITKP